MIYLNNRSVIQTNKKKLYNRGFSLIELIIVIAIMAVLTGILAPSLLSYIHKAKVAADWSNLRAYYSEIQADFTYTGKHDSNIETDLSVPSHWNRTEIHYPSGRTVKLKAGYYAITKNPEGNGYQICYYCNHCKTSEGYEKHKHSCILVLGARQDVDSTP